MKVGYAVPRIAARVGGPFRHTMLEHYICFTVKHPKVKVIIIQVVQKEEMHQVQKEKVLHMPLV
jgi:hypothetical protein